MKGERLVHSVRWPPDPNPDRLLEYEWLVTNGMGGYASGTVSGVVTRRYHGLLVAALPNPLGRVVMLTHLFEQLRLPDGRRIELRGEETEFGDLELHGETFLREFRLEHGLPHWQYHVDGVVLESPSFSFIDKTPSMSPGRCGRRQAESFCNSVRRCSFVATRRP